MDLLEKLGLGWQDILFHVLNLIILVVAMFLLIYKPVRKIIVKRNERLETMFNENKRLNEEALEMKQKYDAMLLESKKEMARLSEEATKTAEAKGAEIILEARVKAKDILDNTVKEMAAEKIRLENEFKNESKDLAFDIATKVLKREVSSSDNRNIIDECLANWEK